MLLSCALICLVECSQSQMCTTELEEEGVISICQDMLAFPFEEHCCVVRSIHVEFI